MRSHRGILAALVAAAAVGVLAFALTSSGVATHSPANKVWVSASTVEFMHSQNGPATPNEVITENPDEIILAQGRGKFSNPTDLRISVTSECALWTNTATFGDDDAESKARVEVWVTIDGKVVPVSLDEEGQPAPNPGPVGDTVDPADQASQQGRVVFCNRATRMKTENIERTTVPGSAGGVVDSDDEDDIVIRSYNRSREANGFNWAALDVGRVYDADGDNRVLIQVHARLATSLRDADNQDNAGDSPMALAGVGKRTLFVEPVKMANDASF